MVDELGTARFYQEEERCVLCLHAQNTVVATGGSVALEARAMNWLSIGRTRCWKRTAWRRSRRWSGWLRLPKRGDSETSYNQAYGPAGAGFVYRSPVPLQPKSSTSGFSG